MFSVHHSAHQIIGSLSLHKRRTVESQPFVTVPTYPCLPCLAQSLYQRFAHPPWPDRPPQCHS